MSSSSSIERELTCSICADLLYDPVEFIDCLHTNCGACAKSWFAALNSNDAAKYTCPVCRSEVRKTRHNSALQYQVEDFIDQNPEKDRTPEEKATLRRIHIPGNGVLPGEANTSPGPPTRRNPSRSTPSSSRSAPTTLDSSTSCCHCQKRVDYVTRYRCSQCDIVACLQCNRLDKKCRDSSANHVQTLEKLQLEPTRHIQTGIFCDICDTWCDSPGSDGGVNSYFWSCVVCNNGNWEICMTCVSKGNFCSHELQLYTNNRLASRNDTVRGNLDLADRLAGLSVTNRDIQLDTLGYVRWTSFGVTCYRCQQQVPCDHSYLHCTSCSNGLWDICMGCWTESPEASRDDDDDDDDDDDGTVFRCHANHKMLLLSQVGREGTHKLILDVPHDPPDYVARKPITGQEQRNGTTGARSAVALKSHWPDPQNTIDGAVYREDTPGERRLDCGGLLAFPEKAAISDVWVAFTEGEGSQLVEYLWGWYAGAGGLFPGDCVRFTD